MTSAAPSATTPHPLATTLFGLFAASAERYPERIALEVRDEVLTYAELDRLAAGLAQRLTAAAAERGTGRPAKVGLLAARSLTAYAGYLAALRAGAAVVPLNPSFPASRILAISATTDLDVIVTDEDSARAARLLTAQAAEDGTPLPPVLALTPAELTRLRTPGPEDVPSSPVAPTSAQDIAYVLYTSGSTGRPRGVPIRHANVLPTLRWLVEEHGFGAEDRLSQNVELSFDVAVLELFTTWSVGAALVIPRPNDVVRPSAFVSAKRITRWFCVPSVGSIAARTNALVPDSMPTMAGVMFGGERLLSEQAEQWAAAAPGARLWNLYGPTEVSIVSTAHELGSGSSLRPAGSNGTLPIGRVPDHLEHVVLDDAGEPAETGELCLRGSQRFDGYLDPADNVGRFLEWRPGARAVIHDGTAPLTRDHWYRTGDRVRVEDGALVFLSRLDHQVKVRGQRVELGDVDAALARHPAVRDAVALVRETGEDSVLVAYYSGEPTTAAELTGFLRRLVPVYMIPGSFTHLAELPLNTNGKVDRAAVAAYDRGTAGPTARSATPPRRESSAR
ncbi:amino acid adenylation domain-containing protein [Streptomyces sp. N2A]|uniref:amino acid adenylation domain-containing protein n=1 Tax=Streptomyces sp. N2A TaxID=3073936 RepID=UPI0028704392|nr:amino acid adenylation domain-containing protein [Streptomyces sp. N2A]